MTDKKTDGSAYIGGNVNTGGGNFASRDMYVTGDNVSRRPQRREPHIDSCILPGEGFPPGAILSAAFIGGTMRIPQGAYRLMQPVQQVNGMFVYVPVSE